MGSAASSIDKKERVQICKERRRLMKQLVEFRGEFANSQLAYMRALKNTGVTLRQFTESESLQLEDTTYGLALPPSPPPTLPPSPPPPPFSPDLRKTNDNKKKQVLVEEIREMYGEDASCSNTTPPPPLESSSAWWDPFLPPSLDQYRMDGETVDEETWAETKTEFDDDEEEVDGLVLVKQQPKHGGVIVEVDSSVTSWYPKETGNPSVVELKITKKSLEGIIKELDDYFLKASAGEKEIVVFMDFNRKDTAIPQISKENKRKRSNSAKVFSALSWSWSSKSLHLARDPTECSSSEPCRPGAHCVTLEKLYAAEQKLYKEVKDEEFTKLEHEKKCTLLQRLEDENHDWNKTEKTRFCVESLESDLRRLQDSISSTCLLLRNLIDDELYPQLVALTSGLGHVWKTMNECHKVQNEICQHLNYLTEFEMDVSTEYHWQATAQLETEVARWYNIFCKLLKSEQEYIRSLCRWIQLTDCLVENQQPTGSSSAVRKLCEDWKLAYEKLPEKAASDAIKSFLSAIQSIIQQQAEEHSLQKSCDKLEKKFHKELLSLADMEKKLEGTLIAEEANSDLSPKNPLSLKRAKTQLLKKRVDLEKARYLDSVQVSKTLTLNNLRTSLPNVFWALVGFSSASALAFEHPIHGPDICEETQDCKASPQNSS